MTARPPLPASIGVHDRDQAAAPADVAAAPGSSRRALRGRLFRKYLLLILVLVGGAVLASGAISVYFSYQENKAAIGALQHEKALAAATRIQQYVERIQQQLAYASLPQIDASDVELRRIEFNKLLRQVPDITDIAQLDANGIEQIAVSRLAMDRISSGLDRSKEPAFGNAKRGQPWFGPVYFRKETEPYMTISLRSSDKGPVTIADVNLKFIWDVVSRIKIGDKGKAYVVDRQGYLIADPDIGLVLRKTNLAELPHVKAAAGSSNPDAPAMLSTDIAGTKVLTSFAVVDPPGWTVFVEQPVAEVYEKLNASIVRTGLLLLGALVISALGALALARGMVRPIRTLDEGAQRIGAGELDQKIEVKTGDELEGLADQFNRMTGKLRESYAGLEHKVEERTKELTNSLEQQTAISEILRVISSSPTDVQPVLDAVAERAAHLCDSPLARVLLVDGDMLRVAASYERGGDQDPKSIPPTPLRRTTFNGRAVLDRQTIHYADVVPLLDTEYPDARPNVVLAGTRAMLAVPLMREGGAYGSIFVFRRETGLFSQDKVALVETFARQAAIAIDNVRLFNETKEGLEQQTAIAEILRVISSSPTDVQPVLEAIADRAARLCDAASASMYLIEGNVLRHLASKGPSPDAVLGHVDAMPISRESLNGRAVLERKTIQLPDLLAEAAEYPLSFEIARKLGHRAVVVTPLYREGQPFGTILLRRLEVRPFSEREIALLKTFGDQAAIALENVRLFNETKEALEQQQASGEVLAAISSSIADTAPVFEKILASCERLFAGKVAGINLVEEDGFIHLAAYHGPNREELERVFPLAIDRRSGSGTAVLSRSVIHYPDVENGEDVPEISRRANKAVGFKGVVYAPMVWEGKAIGVIFVGRDYVGPFSDKDIALLKTFADQAVIAIQNARLFNETKEALDQQRASGEVLSAISSSIADTAPVFETILGSCERLFAGKEAVIDLVGEDGLVHLGAYHGPRREQIKDVYPHTLDTTSATGTAMARRTVVHYASAEELPPFAQRAFGAFGAKAAIGAPMLWEGKGIGAIWVIRDYAGPFSDKEIALLKTFADQAVIAIQNARLFREIQDKSRQLEIANKHKSEFLANMSHELRTPLNAIIGFSEVLQEKLFGDVNDKQQDYLNDIHSSGKHLLGLINDILDLSKVEAGRMELDLSTFDIASALSNAMTLVRERAQRHNVALRMDVDPGLGEVTADERKVKQILVNLLTNAVKFTPDGGRINVTAHRDAESLVVAVRDTGIGIAPEDHEAVFEEFRQVGRDYTKKQEGTGLGLTLTKKFVELHGGRIWVESEPGKGSTFTFTIPVSDDTRRRAPQAGVTQ
jgi:signal transduction histidine kinase/HAMP domain-containing protein/putative methionine-R-sulfoxide reductase with GAF domain